MGDSSNYTAVVAVRSTHNSRAMILEVPSGAFLDNGSMVLIDGGRKQGECISDTVYLDEKTLNMVCAVTNTELPLEKVAGKVNYEWYVTRNAEQ